MSNVISFLEKMGQDAKLRHVVKNDLKPVLDEARISPELVAAVLAGNQLELEKLLGQTNICCAFMPGKEEEEEEIPSNEDEISFMSKVSISASAG